MMNKLLELREKAPLVVCYTNDVVKNFTANGLLSLGASPAMSEAVEEAEDFYKVADALLINIGTMTKDKSNVMLELGKIANRVGVPVVFDPVAVGASSFRKSFVRKFLDDVDVSVIKGNASEILTLIDETTTMKGTDSSQDLDSIKIAQEAYKQYNTAIVLTGKEDVIVQDGKTIVLKNGSEMLTKVTGAGCLLGAVVASFLLRETHPKLDVLKEAVSVFNIAAEQAEMTEGATLPGTFQVALIDELNRLGEETYKMGLIEKEV